MEIYQDLIFFSNKKKKVLYIPTKEQNYISRKIMKDYRESIYLQKTGKLEERTPRNCVLQTKVYLNIGSIFYS